MIKLIPIGFEDLEKVEKDRQKISEMRNGIREKFSEYFSSQGYLPKKPGSIIPENDKSVLFTGATISRFKPYLEKEHDIENGFYIIQNCLRTQNTKTLKNDNTQPKWASYFSSIGAFAKYEKLDLLSKHTWDFFTNCLGIPANRLVLRLAAKDADLLKYWQNEGLDRHLELNANDPSYYTHKFGMEAVTGRNCNLAIIDHRSGNLRDIGNIIVIEKKGIPHAVEIAFGIETIISCILGLPNSIAASLINDIIPICNPYSYKLADAISASVVILNAGVRPIATNRGRVLRSYLQAISYLRKKAYVEIDKIKEYAEAFEGEEFGSITKIPEKILEYIINFEKFTTSGLSPEKINEKTSSIFII